MTSEDIIKIIRDVAEEDIEINEQTELVGGGSSLDSMGLVQLCLVLEEKSMEEGFSFDWTSEKALSSLNSIFKSPKTLALEYNRQLSCSKK
jgi:acyl carrier protein